MTRSAVSSLTSPRVSSLSARETVPGCTFAARATSRRVTEVERTAMIMHSFAGAGAALVGGLRVAGRSRSGPGCAGWRCRRSTARRGQAGWAPRRRGAGARGEFRTVVVRKPPRSGRPARPERPRAGGRRAVARRGRCTTGQKRAPARRARAGRRAGVMARSGRGAGTNCARAARTARVRRKTRRGRAAGDPALGGGPSYVPLSVRNSAHAVRAGDATGASSPPLPRFRHEARACRHEGSAARGVRVPHGRAGAARRAEPTRAGTNPARRCTRLPLTPPRATVPLVPNISYFPVERLEDPELRGYLEHAARHGTPRPESQAIRAHVPAVLRSFSRNWDAVFRNGVLEHRIKELCRVYVSQTIDCHY